MNSKSPRRSAPLSWLPLWGSWRPVRPTERANAPGHRTRYAISSRFLSVSACAPYNLCRAENAQILNRRNRQQGNFPADFVHGERMTARWWNFAGIKGNAPSVLQIHNFFHGVFRHSFFAISIASSMEIITKPPWLLLVNSNFPAAAHLCLGSHFGGAGGRSGRLRGRAHPDAEHGMQFHSLFEIIILWIPEFINRF